MDRQTQPGGLGWYIAGPLALKRPIPFSGPPTEFQGIPVLGSGTLRLFFSHAAEQPRAVSFGDRSGLDRDDFRHLVGMESGKLEFEGGVGRGAGLETREGFGSGFQPSLPAKNRRHGRNEIHARRQLLFHQRCANLSRHVWIRERAKDHSDFIHVLSEH